MCANAIPTPILAINTYVLSSRAKISQKFSPQQKLGPHTKKNLLITYSLRCVFYELYQCQLLGSILNYIVTQDANPGGSW